MRFTRQAILALALAPALFGANKEMVQLQRDVALLQDDVRTLQRSLDEKMSALRTLVSRPTRQLARRARRLLCSRAAFAIAWPSSRRRLRGQ
jgi:hypothetical protein